MDDDSERGILLRLREWVKEAAEACEDADTLDLVYKLLAVE